MFFDAKEKLLKKTITINEYLIFKLIPKFFINQRRHNITK